MCLEIETTPKSLDRMAVRLASIRLKNQAFFEL